MSREYCVAVVGATGAVGTKIIEMLAGSRLPIKEVKFLASARSAGKVLQFKGQEVAIRELVASEFDGVDLALFSAGGSISEKFAPEAVKRGAVVVDNTSAFRMDPAVPLVVPEVNPTALKAHKGIIANPNCSTIQLMVALEPLRQKFGLERVIVSTYQAVSGAGLSAIEELETQLKAMLAGQSASDVTATVLPAGGDKKHYPLAFNALPQIDLFSDEGYTLEEWKMVNEAKKIMSAPDLKISVTCVRVPVLSGHSESVYLETTETPSVSELQAVLSQAPGLVLEDDPETQLYPQALTSVDKKETFVGRVRRDLDVANGYHLWVVADNLIKGAAWNTVQIAETLDELGLVRVN